MEDSAKAVAASDLQSDAGWNPGNVCSQKLFINEVHNVKYGFGRPHRRIRMCRLSVFTEYPQAHTHFAVRNSTDSLTGPLSWAPSLSTRWWEAIWL
jgi:hypothetical protein